MFPADHLALADEAGGVAQLETCFRARYEARARAAGDAPSRARIDAEWASYLDGAYGACLRRVTPEAVYEKESLVASVTALLADPRPGDPTWRGRLRREVLRLDDLERPFAPCDRARFGGAVSRDRLITAPRARYRDLFP
jgi:hypothetical protein